MTGSEEWAETLMKQVLNWCLNQENSLKKGISKGSMIFEKYTIDEAIVQINKLATAVRKR